MDLEDEVCPHCGAPQRGDPDETAELSAPAGIADLPEPSVPQPVPAEPERSSTVESPPRAVAERPSRRPGSLQVRPWHYGLFAGVLGVAILGAIALSGGFGGLRFEDPPDGDLSRVEAFGIGVLGPVEVSGIRPYYDDDYQAHVRAFVANHSNEEASVAFLALMRVREASEQAPPLATFEVVISNPLPPKGGTEIDVPLRAMGTLQSLPPWNEIRVDLEVLGSRSE